MIYFLVLNFMEIPHTIVMYLIYHQLNTGSGFVREEVITEAHFYTWFNLRGVVLPILRLLEPTFAMQFKNLIRSVFCLKKDNKQI
jgi:hypothetical protein